MKNEEQVWELVENKKEDFIRFSDKVFDTPEILYREFKSVSEHTKMLKKEDLIMLLKTILKVKI